MFAVSDHAISHYFSRRKINLTLIFHYSAEDITVVALECNEKPIYMKPTVVETNSTTLLLEETHIRINP